MRVRVLGFLIESAQVLGHIAYHVLAAGLNGYLATVTNLKNPLNKWRCGAAPITAMMTVKRYGSGPGGAFSGKPAVHPATVDLKGKSYELLSQNATKFLLEDIYRNPGPLQFDGPGADAKAVTLCVEDQDYMGRIKELEVYLDKPSWSKKLVRKWLNIQSGAHEFHSDHAMLQTRDGRMSYSGDNSCAIVPEEFSEEWLIEAKDESNGIPKFSPEIPLINLRLAVGTWNVGGNSPNEDLNLKNWLTTHAAADIYVLGFQEIVPLNAGNVLGAEDSGLAAKWLSIMRKALNN